ncbi:hypothetical protein PCAR4_720074 [Paraburkholderia caribensis]|nr:hypothetical protein PCAR4_720074 [Paraburkholderia caribensis]
MNAPFKRFTWISFCLALPNESPAFCEPATKSAKGACAQQWKSGAYDQMLSRVTGRYEVLCDAKLCISYYKVEIRVKRRFVIFESSSR